MMLPPQPPEYPTQPEDAANVPTPAEGVNGQGRGAGFRPPAPAPWDILELIEVDRAGQIRRLWIRESWGGHRPAYLTGRNFFDVLARSCPCPNLSEQYREVMERGVSARFRRSFAVRTGQNAQIVTLDFSVLPGSALACVHVMTAGDGRHSTLQVRRKR